MMKLLNDEMKKVSEKSMDLMQKKSCTGLDGNLQILFQNISGAVHIYVYILEETIKSFISELL